MTATQSGFVKHSKHSLDKELSIEISSSLHTVGKKVRKSLSYSVQRINEDRNNIIRRLPNHHRYASLNTVTC